MHAGQGSLHATGLETLLFAVKEAYHLVKQPGRLAAVLALGTPLFLGVLMSAWLGLRASLNAVKTTLKNSRLIKVPPCWVCWPDAAATLARHMW